MPELWRGLKGVVEEVGQDLRAQNRRVFPRFFEDFEGETHCLKTVCRLRGTGYWSSRTVFSRAMFLTLGLGLLSYVMDSYNILYT